MRKLSTSKPLHLLASLLIIASVSGIALAQAAPTHIKFEAESGTLSGNATKFNDTTAASGQAVQFSGGGTGFDPRQTLPPGSALPSDATCNSRVTPAVEIRPQNANYNSVAGHNKNLPGLMNSRVSGAYTGSTDEILQWVACKWGIDVNIVRAQAVMESYWTQANKGDWTTNQSACPPAHPLGADGTAGQCPESYGILQVRYAYHGPPAGLNTWPEAETSTAYNADYTYSVWRECYEGNFGWLNTVERGEDYRAGDAWGCVGVWFSGRWKTQPANTYIGNVQNHFNQLTWTTPGFINFR